MSRRRAVIGGILSLLYPGLGHLYLRRWLRALAWFGLAIATAALVVPESTLESVRAGGLDAAIEASRSLPRRAVVSLLIVRLLTALDAVLVAFHRLPGDHRATPEGPTCPNCGREVDPEIEFCHWCTTRLDSAKEN